IHQPDIPHARSRKVKPERRAQSAGADQQYFRAFQLKLTLHAHFRHDQVAAVSQYLFIGQARRRRVPNQRLCFGGHSTPRITILPAARASEKPFIASAHRLSGQGAPLTNVSTPPVRERQVLVRLREEENESRTLSHEPLCQVESLWTCCCFAFCP